MNLSYNAQGDQILRVSPGTMTYNIGSTIYYINAVNNTLNIHSKQSVICKISTDNNCALLRKVITKHVWTEKSIYNAAFFTWFSDPCLAFFSPSAWVTSSGVELLVSKLWCFSFTDTIVCHLGTILPGFFPLHFYCSLSGKLRQGKTWTFPTRFDRSYPGVC